MHAPMLMVLFACSAPVEDGELDVDAYVGVPGCVENAAAFESFKVSVDPEMGTVLHASWFGEPATLHYEDALGHARAVELVEEAVLVGFLARDLVSLQLVVGETCSPVRIVETGSLPAGLPEAEVTRGDGPETEAFVAVSVMTQMDRRAMVFETVTGEPVWQWALPQGTLSPAFRVHLRHDGGGVLVNVRETPNSIGGLYRVDWDGQSTFIAVPGSGVDFYEHTDGTLTVLSTQIRMDESGTLIEGDRLLKVGPDGDVVEIWNMFDDYPHEFGPTTLSTDEGDYREWAHANGLAYDEGNHAYLLSLPNIRVVASIDVETRGLNWRLGDRGDFTETGLGSLGVVDMPHSVQLLDDGNVLLFNRGIELNCSYAAEVALSMEAGTADLVWDHASASCLTVAFLGEALRLPDGDTVIVWSSSGTLDIVSPEGDLRWRMALDFGAGFGFVEHATQLGG